VIQVLASKLIICSCCSLTLHNVIRSRAEDFCAAGFCAADFAALALSCRRLNAVAEEALYAQNRDRNRSSAIHWAAKHGNTATLDKALKHGLDIHQQSSAFTLDSSPLNTAVVHGKDSAVAWFLDHGADVTLTVRSLCPCPVGKSSILHTALCFCYVSTAQLLIFRGAPLYYSAHGRSSTRETNALLDASLHGLDTIVEALVKEYGMSLRTRYSPEHHDALACAAMSDDNVSTVRTLLSLGADANGYHKEWQSSPLFVALDEGNFGVANTLLELGAKIHPYECDTTGDLSIGGEDDEKTQLGSEKVQVQVAPLHETIRTLTNRRGPRTWIHYPSRFARDVTDDWQAERTCFMRRLIQLGADINMEALGSWTGDGFEHWFSPLDLAIDIGTIQDVEMLIASGAKMNHSMLFTACNGFDKGLEGEELEKARLLLKHGARMDEPIRDDMTLLQLAVERSDITQETSGLHELLLLSSPKSLSSNHLDKVLAECLVNLDWYPSTVLIRHGARV
jgi:ankyrin repeat protein